MKELEVTVQRACGDTDTPEDDCFELWAAAALAGRWSGGELTLRLVSRDEMQSLNRRYRNRDAPTNVLSFPADLPPEVSLPLLGDLVICPEVVRAEASAQGKTASAHWAHLVVHGVLHLLGYDHIDDDAAAHMESLEISILATLDHPNPYSDIPIAEDSTPSHE